MDSVENYVKQFAKHKKENLDTLSEECEALMQIIIKQTYIVFVCISHYINCWN